MNVLKYSKGLLTFPCSMFNGFKYRFQQKVRKKKLQIKSATCHIERYVTREGSGTIQVGTGSIIRQHTSFSFGKLDNQSNPTIKIGSGVRIAKWADFGCSNCITIEDNVIIGPYVHITDRNHEYRDVTKPVKFQGVSSNGSIRICSGTWIGFRVQIMSGVTIGKNCVVAAGAVVTKDIPDFCVAGGNPARVLRRYNFETKQWEKP